MTSTSDEKWRPFNCFFSRVGLRTYQHSCTGKIRRTSSFSPMSSTLRPQTFGALDGPSALSPLRPTLNIGEDLFVLGWGWGCVCDLSYGYISKYLILEPHCVWEVFKKRSQFSYDLHFIFDPLKKTKPLLL